MISTAKKPKMNFESTCNGYRELHEAEFWNIEIIPTGLIGRWHKEDKIKNYIQIEYHDPSVHIVVSFPINLITKHDLNTNLS